MAKVVKLFDDTYEELKRVQEEIRRTKGFRLTLGSVIDYVLKEWRTNATLWEADKKLLKKRLIEVFRCPSCGDLAFVECPICGKKIERPPNLPTDI